MKGALHTMARRILTPWRWPVLVVAGVGLSACALQPAQEDLTPAFQAMMAQSFRTEGIATLDRLQQDEAQQACSAPEAPAPALARRLEAQALATVQPPPDGRYLGDWREGEKLAQNGRGLTWTDKSADPAANGASCYNCHQISPAEISHGSIGPSLAQFGRLRGVADPSSPAARAVVQYTWGKLYNAQAYQACSLMPRFGHKGLLNPTQLQHLMALLLDPASPVNAP
jgi:sulfur-oxidizing protein SoxX